MMSKSSNLRRNTKIGGTFSLSLKMRHSTAYSSSWLRLSVSMAPSCTRTKLHSTCISNTETQTTKTISSPRLRYKILGDRSGPLRLFVSSTSLFSSVWSIRSPMTPCLSVSFKRRPWGTSKMRCRRISSHWSPGVTCLPSKIADFSIL